MQRATERSEIAPADSNHGRWEEIRMNEAIRNFQNELTALVVICIKIAKEREKKRATEIQEEKGEWEWVIKGGGFVAFICTVCTRDS